MSFETEMNTFFMRNCYTEKERTLVRQWPAYRRAVESDDTTAAQEIATQVQEGKIRPELSAPAP